ncbi:AraC family transcriptional regulator [Flexivirga oryzae]|uniref:AraC-like DNA-binding protein n=1 Tax=Flexivirga oryzae TaxID=1794944 RepID=A0A839N926_9MICO|nr:AraC family transcriptional regulator [Flexivirga oryzae]MBB2894260.1 AraC-like DNA-binding protein [Flexivirga oryzae]
MSCVERAALAELTDLAVRHGRRLGSAGVTDQPDLIDGPRARGAFVLRVVMQPPWALEIAEDAPLTMVAMLTGGTWLRRTSEPPQRLVAGDVLLVRGLARYIMSDEPTTAPDIRIGPGQTCSGTDGRDLSDELGAGVRAWGNDPAGRDTMLVASYADRAQLGTVLAGALPDFALVCGADSPLLPVLVQEAARDALGQDAVLDRILDVVLISVVRAWAAETPSAVGGLRVLADPAVAEAVRLIRAEPAHGWTVEALAAAAGVSRAALARRFQEVVGMPPIGYLAQWRLSLAADLLRGSDRTVASVAREVGYGSPFSLSAAFKKMYGVSPQAYRSSPA